MRRSLKAKTCFILLAWLTIFVHNVIPHNHIDENIAGCHELIHNFPDGTGDASKTSRYVNQPGEITVCHLSNFLFHNFNQENLYTPASQRVAFNPSGLQENICVFPEEKHISEHYPGCFLLRAPPAA
jgi:hypothetical protein